MARKRNGSDDYILIGAAFLGALIVAKLFFGRAEAGAGESSGGNNPAGLSDESALVLKDKRVLLIGSSSAVGYGSHLKTLLAGHGIADFKNIGVSGTNIRQWPDSSTVVGRALDKSLAEYRPDVVFIFVGTNDEALRGSRPNRNIAGLCASAIEALHGKLSGTRSIFIGLPPHKNWPMDPNFRALLASTWGKDYFNLEPVNPAKASDGYHLSQTGYRSLSAALDPWLTDKEGK
jgi:lysophospholipase L1-like esterase